MRLIPLPLLERVLQILCLCRDAEIMQFRDMRFPRGRGSRQARYPFGPRRLAGDCCARFIIIIQFFPQMSEAIGKVLGRQRTSGVVKIPVEIKPCVRAALLPSLPFILLLFNVLLAHAALRCFIFLLTFTRLRTVFVIMCCVSLDSYG